MLLAGEVGDDVLEREEFVQQRSGGLAVEPSDDGVEVLDGWYPQSNRRHVRGHSSCFLTLLHTGQEGNRYALQCQNQPMNTVQRSSLAIRMHSEQMRRRSLRHIRPFGDIYRDRLGQRLSWYHFGQQELLVGVEKRLGLVVKAALAETSGLEVLCEVVVGRHPLML